MSLASDLNPVPPVDKLEKRVKKLENLIGAVVRASQELERVSVGLIKRTDTLAISVDKLSLAVREIQQKFN